MRSLLVFLMLATSSLASLQAQAEQVNIYSFRQPFLIEPILKEFTAQTGIETKVIFPKKGLIKRLQREGELSTADLV